MSTQIFRSKFSNGEILDHYRPIVSGGDSTPMFDLLKGYIRANPKMDGGVEISQGSEIHLYHVKPVRIVAESNLDNWLRIKREKMVTQSPGSGGRLPAEKRKACPEGIPILTSAASSANVKRARREDLPTNTMSGNWSNKTEGSAEHSSTHPNLGRANAKSDGHRDGLSRSGADIAASGPESRLNTE